MRRPLNWVVVCLSLLFLLANLSFNRNRSVTGQTAAMALAETEHLDNLFIARNDPQFGYVRADGSFLPLTKQEVEPAVAEVGAAVYVWSSPISASKVPASF
jgi:hypothetical protein